MPLLLEQQLPPRLSTILSDSLLDEAPRIDKSNKLPPHLLEELKEEGFFAICIPRELGGLGLGLTGLVELARTSAKSCLTISIMGVNHCVASMLIYKNGGRMSIDLLPKMSTGELVATLAIEENGLLEEAPKIRTTFKQTNGYYVINGEKPVCIGGTHSNIFLTLARKGDSFKLFIVEADKDATKVEEIDALILRGLGISKLKLINARVPQRMVFEGDGLKLAEDALRIARLAYSASSLGVIEGLLDHVHAHITGELEGPILASLRRKLSKIYLSAKSLKRLIMATAIDSDMKGHVELEDSISVKLLADQLLDDTIKLTVRVCGRECLEPGSYAERMVRDSYLLGVITGPTDRLVEVVSTRIAQEESIRL